MGRSVVYIDPTGSILNGKTWKGWTGGIRTWDVQANGTIWSENKVETGNPDLAENYLSDKALSPDSDVSCR